MFGKTARNAFTMLKRINNKKIAVASCGVVAGGVGLAVLAQYADVASADEKPMFVINGTSYSLM